MWTANVTITSEFLKSVNHISGFKLATSLLVLFMLHSVNSHIPQELRFHFYLCSAGTRPFLLAMPNWWGPKPTQLSRLFFMVNLILRGHACYQRDLSVHIIGFKLATTNLCTCAIYTWYKIFQLFVFETYSEFKHKIAQYNIKLVAFYTRKKNLFTTVQSCLTKDFIRL
mgnify:CR=1 FL=1